MSRKLRVNKIYKLAVRQGSKRDRQNIRTQLPMQTSNSDARIMPNFRWQEKEKVFMR